MPPFDALLFDFDGVLIDSEPVHCACWAEVIAPLGARLEWEWYRQHAIGIDDKDMLRAIAANVSPPLDWQRLWEKYPAKKELFRLRMLAAAPFPHGLSGVLESLHARYQTAVVTSSGRSEVEPLLVAGGLRRHFDTLVCAEDTEHHKPAPDPYLLAARRLNARAPLVLEDSRAGMAAARAANFAVVEVSHPDQLARILERRLSTAAPTA